MIRRVVIAASSALMLVLLLAPTGRAVSAQITVPLDETTLGDLEIVATSVKTVANGTEVQRSVRRLSAGVAGEMALLASQRFSNGWLTLDDGTQVPVDAGDQISVSAKGESSGSYVTAQGATLQAPMKRVILIPDPSCTSGHCSMKPYAILILANSSCRQVLLFAHPPVVGAC